MRARARLEKLENKASRHNTELIVEIISFCSAKQYPPVEEQIAEKRNNGQKFIIVYSNHDWSREAPFATSHSDERTYDEQA